MITYRTIDSPWHRLPWTLPSALLLWVLALWGLACFMGSPADRQVEPASIEAQLIEQSAPTVIQHVQSTRSAVIHQPKALTKVRPKQTTVMPQANPRTGQNPVVTQKKDVTTGAAVVLPATASGNAKSTSSSGVVNFSTIGNSQVGTSNGKASLRGSMFANSGARAIVRPMPQIPDELRDAIFNLSALALFHIAVDGSVTVELAKPTPNPRLNRILLNSLTKWRFIPAIKNGKPVASTEEIVVRIEVK